MNLRPIIILAVLAALIVGVAIWFLQTPPSTSTPLPAAILAQPRPPEPAATPGPGVIAATPQSAPSAAAASATPAPAIAEWEMRIDRVLQSGNSNNSEIAQTLANMLPSLPAEGQADAAQHISNLTLDAEYARLGALMRNASLPREVHDVLMTDLMNRDDEVKLPTMLDVAKNPQHPHQEEALTTLQVFLEADHGNDWGKWEASLKEYLRKHAADKAAMDAADLPPAPAGAAPAP